MKLFRPLTPLLLAALVPATLHADEHLWGYTRTAETLPKGEWELYYSNTFKIDKNTGQYLAWEFTPEIEYGITHKLTASVEVIGFYHRFRDLPFDPYTDIDRNKAVFGGFDINLKYNILSTYKDPFGLAVGLAYEKRYHYRLDGAETDQDSVEPKIYLQKNFLDDTLVLALSGGAEFERRYFADGTLEEEISFDFALGVAYRFARNWYVGLEGRVQADFLEAGFNSFNDLKLGFNFQHGVYVGPSIHYGGKSWWFTIGLLTQAYGGPDRDEPSSDGGHNWDEHERLHVRVTIGFNF